MNSGILFFWRAALSYPLSWLVLALLAALPIALNIWFQGPFALLLVLLATSLALFVLWVLMLSKDEHFQRRFHSLGSGIDDAQLIKLYRLEGQLRELGAEQGAEQLRQLRDRFDALSRLLIRRVHHGEMAYGQHLAQLETALLAVLNDTDATLPELRQWHEQRHPDDASYELPAAARQVFHATGGVLVELGELTRLLSHTSLATPYESIAAELSPLVRLGHTAGAKRRSKKRLH